MITQDLEFYLEFSSCIKSSEMIIQKRKNYTNNNLFFKVYIANCGSFTLILVSKSFKKLETFFSDFLI